MKFTNKKIFENLERVENLDYALVLPDGDLYIHCHGEGTLQKVYDEGRDSFCDVTEYVRDYSNSEYSKRDTARMIRESAEIFYEQ